MQAEFENYRKRTIKQQADQADAGRRARSSSAAAGARRLRRRGDPRRRRRRARSTRRCSTRSTKAGPRGRRRPRASPSTRTVHEAVLHEAGDGGAASRTSPRCCAPATSGRAASCAPPWSRSGTRADGADGSPQREWFEKDYYEVLGVAETRRAEGDHERVPQAGPAAPPRRQPRRRRGRGALQGGLRRLRRARRRGQAQGVRRGPPARPDGGRLRRAGRPRRLHASHDDARRPRRPLRRALQPRRRGGGRRRRAVAGHRAPAGRRPREPSCTCRSRTPCDGVTTTVNLTSDVACSTCHGTGAKPGHHAAGVPGVRRPGRDRRQPGLLLVPPAVPRLPGPGLHRSTSPCPTCRGAGIERRAREVKVRVPAGVDDGQRIRLKGRGGPGRNGGPPATSTSRSGSAEHPLFGRKGDDLTLTVPVTFPEAALGADVTVPTLDGAAGHHQGPAGHPLGAHVPGQGQGHRRRRSARATCWSPSRSPCPPSSPTSERKAVEALAAAADGVAPRATWGC